MIRNGKHIPATNRKKSTYATPLFRFLNENNIKLRLHIGELVLVSFFHQSMGHSKVYKHNNPNDSSGLGHDHYFKNVLKQAKCFLNEMEHLY